MKSVKFLGKISMVLLIFFSLQGEVVQRYVDPFKAKLEHRASIPKHTAERQQLIKLQCYTQKILPVALPAATTSFNFSTPVKSLAKSNYIIADNQLTGPLFVSLPSLRGPPSLK